jgi:hypothetical protein
MLNKDFVAQKRDALVRERAMLLAKLNAAEGAINLCDVFLAEIDEAVARMREATSGHAVPGAGE